MPRSRPSFVRRLVQLVAHAEARDDAAYELRRRILGEPQLPAGPITRALVLCHGNICRSPFAAALLALRVPGLEVRSCGLAAGEGATADETAARHAARFEVDLSAHRAQPLAHNHVEWADLILAMQGHQAFIVRDRFPEAATKTRLLGDFLPAAPYTIVDPWGEPDDVFEAVFAQLALAVDRLAARLAQQARSGI
jgi:protein-tyrosine phosphatase